MNLCSLEFWPWFAVITGTRSTQKSEFQKRVSTKNHLDFSWRRNVKAVRSWQSLKVNKQLWWVVISQPDVDWNLIIISVFKIFIHTLVQDENREFDPITMSEKISDPRFTKLRVLYILMTWLWILSFGNDSFKITHGSDSFFMIQMNYIKTSTLPTGVSFCCVYWDCMHPHLCSIAIKISIIYRDSDFRWNCGSICLAFSCTSRK